MKKNGKPLFCGSDVAKALGYAKPQNAIAAHCKGALKRGTHTNGGEQEMLFISEGDVYRLITHSKLPSAENFEKWVFDEVLPVVRKTGGYVANDDKFIDTYLPFADDTTKLLFRSTLETVRKQNELIAEMKPKALFADAVCKSKDNVLVRTMAKILSDNGFAIGQNKLYQLLRNKKVLMRNNEPYQQYMDLKYFVYEEVPVETPYGVKLEHTTKITPNGQLWITSKIKEWKEEIEK